MPRSTNSRKAKSQRNQVSSQALAPVYAAGHTAPTGIHRLPLESLAHIFSYVVPPFCDPEEYRSSILRKYGLKWSGFVQVMLVCHRWRSAATLSPGLWTFVDATNMKMGHLKAALERSGTLPLDIIVHMDKVPGGALNLVAKHSQRLRKLSICVGAASVNRTHTFLQRLSSLQKAFKDPAPLLEAIFLFVGHSCTSTTAFEFPALFRIHHPSLRVLYLEHIATWPRDIFRNLTDLHLSPRFSSSSTLRPILELLRASPNIESVELPEYAIKSDDDDVSLGDQLGQIHLPRLRKLQIQAHSADVKSFLSCLVLPADICNLSINSDFGDNDGAHPENPFAFVLPDNALQREPFASVTGVGVLQGMTPWSVCIEGWIKAFPTIRIDLRDNSAIMFEDESDSEDEGAAVFEKTVLGLSHIFPLDKTVSLNLDAVNDRTGTMWEDLLARTPLLQELVTADDPHPDVFQALTPIASIQESVSGSMSFPDLRVIQVCGRRISNATMLAICQVVEDRQALSLPLPQVCLLDEGRSDRNTAGYDPHSFRVLQRLLKPLGVECEIS